MGTPTHFSGLATKVQHITNTTTYTFMREHSGRVHVAPDLTADATWTLPAAEDGLRFEIMYAGTAADAQDWIINTASTASLFKGGVVHLDTDAGAAGIEVVAVDADLSNDDTFTVNVPFTGTWILLVSDGTHWYVTGQVVSTTAPAFS